jgi:hypothetical protein
MHYHFDPGVANFYRLAIDLRVFLSRRDRPKNIYYKYMHVTLLLLLLIRSFTLHVF